MEIFGACADCLFADLKLSEEPCAHCNWENDKFQRMPTSAEILALRARAETAETEVARLRAALEKIASGWVIDKDQITTADVARAALEARNENDH